MIEMLRRKLGGFRNNRSAKVSPVIEEKSLQSILQTSFGDFNFGLQNPNSWHQVHDAESAQFYQENSVVFSAIDIIAQEFSRIAPVVRDVETGEIIPDHPVLQLLKRPNPFDTEDSFLNAWARNFLISGNAFVSAEGEVTRAPVSIFALLSQNIQTEISQTDGYPVQYRATPGGVGSFINYFRVGIDSGREEIFGTFRFYGRKLDSDVVDLELWHTRNFNPRVGNSNAIGMSKLSSIFYEAHQLNQGNVHNWSQLKRGARPTAIMSVKEGFSLTERQREDLSSQINDYYSGANNAGRPLMLPEGLEISEFSTSNKDMDFMALKMSASNSIYNVYRVPLALMSTDSMTLNNFKEAKLFLYDNAVIPLAGLLYGELTNFLMPRYGDNPFEKRITIDTDDIPALEIRRLDRAEKLSKLGIMTINELRREVGFEDIGEKGDTIASTGSSFSLMDSSAVTMKSSQLPCSHRDTYRRMARQIVDADGNRVYSDEDIEREADKVKPKK